MTYPVFPVDAPSYEMVTAGWQDGFNFAAHKKEILSGMVATLTSQPVPQFFHTLGFAASGKSTLIRHLKNEHYFPEKALYLGFDALMENLLPYQEDLQRCDAAQAFQNWEVTARVLGYELLAFALAQKYHVVFEHSGARDDHVELLRFAQQHYGYRVTLLETQCSPEKAWERAALRERYLPRDYITGRAEKIAQLRPAYVALADVFETYDTENLPISRVTAAEKIAA